MINQGCSVTYRCRLCNATFSPVHVPDAPTIMNVMLGTEEIPKAWFGFKPGAVEVHQCSPKLRGVADFVGVQIDPSEAELIEEVRAEAAEANV